MSDLESVCGRFARTRFLFSLLQRLLNHNQIAANKAAGDERRAAGGEQRDQKTTRSDVSKLRLVSDGTGAPYFGAPPALPGGLLKRFPACLDFIGDGLSVLAPGVVHHTCPESTSTDTTWHQIGTVEAEGCGVDQNVALTTQRCA